MLQIVNTNSFKYKRDSTVRMFNIYYVPDTFSRPYFIFTIQVDESVFQHHIFDSFKTILLSYIYSQSC